MQPNPYSTALQLSVLPNLLRKNPQQFNPNQGILLDFAAIHGNRVLRDHVYIALLHYFWETQILRDLEITQVLSWFDTSSGTFRTGLCPTASFTVSHTLQTFVLPQVKGAFRVAARLLSSRSTAATPDTEKDVLVCSSLLLVFTVPALKFISASIGERSLKVRAAFWPHLM